MEKTNKAFEDIYRKSNTKTTNSDKIELITDFIDKMKNMISHGQFIIKELEREIEN
jgi:hypothetical protein